MTPPPPRTSPTLIALSLYRFGGTGSPGQARDGFDTFDTFRAPRVTDSSANCGHAPAARPRRGNPPDRRRNQRLRDLPPHRHPTQHDPRLAPADIRAARISAVATPVPPLLAHSPLDLLIPPAVRLPAGW